jgi:hypothetical protein
MSPTTEKTRGIMAPIPTDPMTVAMIKKTNVVLSRLRMDPARAKVMEMSNMIRRPYMSESLPKIMVTKAPTSPAIETDQAYRLGWLLFWDARF